MSQNISPKDDALTLIEKQTQRIDELESRALFMDETVEQLNLQLATLTQEFELAKQAMQLLNRRLEHMQSQPSVKDFSEETPPPHY